MINHICNLITTDTQSNNCHCRIWLIHDMNLVTTKKNNNKHGKKYGKARYGCYINILNNVHSSHLHRLEKQKNYQGHQSCISLLVNHFKFIRQTFLEIDT